MQKSSFEVRVISERKVKAMIQTTKRVKWKAVMNKKGYVWNEVSAPSFQNLVKLHLLITDNFTVGKEKHPTPI